VPLFFGGRAREVLRKLRKDVLPEARAPMIRMLGNRSVSTDHGLNDLEGYVLERGRVFTPAHSAWRVDCADCAGRVRVSASMGHRLGASVRIYPFSTPVSIF
jgi:hypothetical protein